MTRHLSEARRRRLAGRCSHWRQDDDVLPDTFWWELRYYAAMHAACYVTIRIDQPHLRMRVVEHVAVCWWRSLLNGGHPGGFEGLFHDYGLDVERDIDRKTTDVTWELHRVWTNHAVLLGGELHEVYPRPQCPPAQST